MRSGSAVGERVVLGERAVIGERYVIERALGTGGMGSVYLAVDRATERQVAIKVLDVESEDLAQRLQREARLLSELSHPAIVRYVDYGEAESGRRCFLAMEFLEGEDLSKFLGRARLSPKRGIALVRRVAEALAFAHRHGVVHRDVKPGNIFLVGSDPTRVKVIDFGLATTRYPSRALTQSGMLLGTLGYMAPEQIWGARDVDARADVFSLGCVLFECLAGRAAFAAVHSVAMIAKVLSEEVPRLSDLASVPEEVDALVARLLAKDPATRPPDAGAVLAELDRLGPFEEAAVAAPSPSARLSGAERRIVSIILAEGRAGPEGAGPGGAERTALEGASGEAVSELSPLESLAQSHGGRLYRLNQRAILIELRGSGTAKDRARLAASCALSLARIRPSLRIALSTGRAELSSELPAGPAIDRAAALLRATAKHAECHVALDDVTAGLLGSRYEVLHGKDIDWLVAENVSFDVPRLLLGKRTPCVGRNAELIHLEAVLDECIDYREPRAVIVTAPPGIGKSRLASEFVQRARQRKEVRILYANAEAETAGSHLSLARSLVRYSVGIRDLDTGPEQLERLRDHLAGRADPAELEQLVDVLGELVGLSRDYSSINTPVIPGLRASKTGTAILREQRWALDTWLKLETEQPLVMILDDLHWADVPSLTQLGHALAEPGARSLLLIGLGRPEVHAQLLASWKNGQGHPPREVRLGGLSPGAAERLVRAVAGDDVEPLMVQRIVDRAGGNAFYLEELIRHVARGESFLPETLVAMAEARLGRLEPDARRVLRAASVYGETFWTEGVAALVGEGVDVASWLEFMTDGELLVRAPESRFPELDQYGFRHALLRNAAYEMMTDADRRVAHRLASHWLDSAGEKNSALLAFHSDKADDHDAAARHYLRAGDVATHQCAYGEARKHYEASLSHLTRVPETDAMRRRKVDTLLRQIYATLVADTAEQNFQRAAEIGTLLDTIFEAGEYTLEDVKRRVRSDYVRGRIHFYRSELDQAIQYSERVPAFASEFACMDDDLVGLAMCVLGAAKLLQGHALEAESILASAVPRVEVLGEPFEWFRAVGYHGLSSMLIGRCREGAHALDRILAKADEIQQPGLLAAANIMTGTAYLLAGDWPTAHRCLSRALEHATASGDKLLVNLAWSGVGWAGSFLGRHAEARAARESARAISDAMGGRLLLDDWYRAADAEIAYNAGDIELALELSSTLVQATSGTDLILSRGIAERVWGDSLVQRGDWRSGVEHLRRSIELFERGGLTVQIARTRLHLALALRHTDSDRAEGELRDSVRCFEASGCEYAARQAAAEWAGDTLEGDALEADALPGPALEAVSP